MSDEPILEIDTEAGSIRRHGLTLNDIEHAQRLLAERQTTAAEIEN
jgi:hypothetical protein